MYIQHSLGPSRDIILNTYRNGPALSAHRMYDTTHRMYNTTHRMYNTTHRMYDTVSGPAGTLS